jgi:hypothetical protein
MVSCDRQPSCMAFVSNHPIWSSTVYTDLHSKWTHEYGASMVLFTLAAEKCPMNSSLVRSIRLYKRLYMSGKA